MQRAVLGCVLGLGWLAVCGCRTGHPDLSSFLERSRRIRSQPVEWEAAERLRFASPRNMERFRVVDGGWEIANGKLWAMEGEGHRAILLAASGHDPVRIEFEAIGFATGGRLGDITVLLNTVPDERFFNHGYALTTGSFWNHCTTFYREGKPIARTEYSPLVSGKPNRVALEFNRGHIRYWLNDEIILEAWDPEPLTMSPELWIGIRTWATRMGIANVRILSDKDACR